MGLKKRYVTYCRQNGQINRVPDIISQKTKTNAKKMIRGVNKFMAHTLILLSKLWE